MLACTFLPLAMNLSLMRLYFNNRLLLLFVMPNDASLFRLMLFLAKRVNCILSSSPSWSTQLAVMVTLAPLFVTLTLLSLYVAAVTSLDLVSPSPMAEPACSLSILPLLLTSTIPCIWSETVALAFVFVLPVAFT